MKDTKNKLIFISGVVFALVLLWVSSQVITATWQPPTGTFPNANVAPPIDQSGENQSKVGSIEISGRSGAAFIIEQGRSINTSNLGDAFLTLMRLDNSTILKNGYSHFDVNTLGLLLPRYETNGLNQVEGMITYSPSEKTVKLYNGEWINIGTGTGSGDSFWRENEGGIYYGGGDVVINNTLADASVERGFWPTGNTITLSRGENGALYNSRRLACDTSSYTLNTTCSAQQPYTGGYLNQATPAPVVGDYGYDRYEEDSETQNELDIGIIKYKIFKYEERVITSNTPTENTAKVTVGKVVADDIDLSNPSWSFTSREKSQVGGSSEWDSDIDIDGWVTCDDGEFLSGIRFGIRDDKLILVGKCSKL